MQVWRGWFALSPSWSAVFGEAGYCCGHQLSVALLVTPVLLPSRSNADSSAQELPPRAEAAKAAGNRAFFERDWPGAVSAYSQVTSANNFQMGHCPSV